MTKGKIFLVFIILIFSGFCSEAQVEKRHTYKKKITERKAFQFTVAPVALIGAGVYTMETNGFLNKHRVQESVQYALPTDFRTRIDDYTQYAPQVFALGYTVMQKPNTSEISSLLTKMVVSNLSMHFVVEGGKEYFGVGRPDNPDAHSSFPSGHTAQAFVSATVMHKELGHKNIWYSVAGYSIATATGAMRVMNNRHYISDVLAGAGVGILTTHLSYWLVDAVENKFFSRRKRYAAQQQLIER